MAKKSDGNQDHETSSVEDEERNTNIMQLCLSNHAITMTQKVIAEFIGTYFVVFAGCGVVAVNKIYGSVTFPGICITWGLIVMVMCYSVGHISGGHFNPAVTITWAILRRISIKEALLYILAQMFGSILASGTLSLIFEITSETHFGTVPVGSNAQSLVIEIITSFLLLFVVSALATDERAVNNLTGVAVGMTIMLNVFIAGPVSGASMNPARSIGAALVVHIYKGLWIYIVGPIVGAIGGAITYNFLRSIENPHSELPLRNIVVV